MATVQTTTAIPAAVTTHFDRLLLLRVVAANVYRRWGQQRPLDTASGKTLVFRRYSSLADQTTAMSPEGTNKTALSVSYTDISATISTYGGHLEYTDDLELTTDHPILNEFHSLITENAASTLDIITRDIVTATSTKVYSNGSAITDINTVISDIALRTAIRTLKRNNARQQTEMIKGSTGLGTVPIRAGFIAVVHPDTTAQLNQIAEYVPVSKYSDAMKAEENEVGAYREIRFFESTHGKVTASAGAAVGTDGMISTDSTSNDVYLTWICGKEAYGIVDLRGNGMKLIMKPRTEGGPSNPYEMVGTIAWKAKTTTKILNDNFMVTVLHANLSSLT